MFSFLFNSFGPWNQLAGREGSLSGRVPRAARHPVRLRRPLKSRGNASSARPSVPITASGLLGEQPLVDRVRWLREVGKIVP